MLRRIFLQSSLMTLAGCSIIPERPPLKLYDLPLGNSSKPCSGVSRRLSSVKVNLPMVASPYDTPKLFILGKDNRFFNTDINRLVANPDQLIADAIRNRLQQCGPWKTVLLPNSIAPFDYEMTVYVPKFYISAQEKPYTAVCGLDVSVTQGDSSTLIFHRTFINKAEIQEVDINGAIKGLAQATDLNLDELIQSINTAIR